MILTAACYCDYRKRKIPNILIITAAICGAVWRFAKEGITGAIFYLVQSVMVLALFYLLFRIGAVGAGDVKLFGVTAGYLPFHKILFFLFVSLLISAIISLVKLWEKNNFYKRLRYLVRYLKVVWKCGSFRPYPETGLDDPDITIRLAGPIFLSLLLYLGGVY